MAKMGQVGAGRPACYAVRMRWILTVWLLATGCGELEFPAIDGGQDGQQSDGLSGAAGASGMGHAGGGSVGGREPVQVPDGGMGTQDAGGAVDGAVAQDGGGMGSLDAGAADSGADSGADTGVIDAGQDAGLPPCTGTLDFDENQIPDECEGCPAGGCKSVLWTANVASGIQDITHSDVSLFSGIRIIGPVRVEGVQPYQAQIYLNSGLVDSANSDRELKMQVQIHGVRTDGSVYDETTQANALPSAGIFRYLKLTTQSDGTIARYRWAIHGTP